MKKIGILLCLALLSSGAIAIGSAFVSATHDHSTVSDEVLGHSGRTDSRGGHNCSEASKRKGLCTGYHYH